MSKMSGKGDPLSRKKRRLEKARKESARQRLEVILKVRSGQMTASEGATLLGVSRKTYYEWETRALEAMLQALEDGQPGRPPNPVDPERESLRKKVSELEQELILTDLKRSVQELLRNVPEAVETTRTTADTSPTRLKKTTGRERVVSQMNAARENTGLSWRTLCDTTPAKCSSFMRWKSRLERQEPVVQRPGSKKVEPLDLGRLQKEMRKLHHGPKQTHGTGALYQQFQNSLSRRQLQELVDLARRDACRERRALMRRIQWNVPGLVWSLDESELWTNERGHKVTFLTVQDLASGYKFAPIVGTSFPGEEVAGHLEALFSMHGPPLFLKRDNAGNLNHQAVDDVLSWRMVLPLNSPTYYPPYNGAIEHTQGETKQELKSRALRLGSPCPPEHLDALAEAAAHNLNHQERRNLNGWNSCGIFFAGKARAAYSKRLIKEIYDGLIETQSAIIAAMERREECDREAAWRIAVEQWLVINRHIRILITWKSCPVSRKNGLITNLVAQISASVCIPVPRSTWPTPGSASGQVC
jgi:transposase InsO family protein/transposase